MAPCRRRRAEGAPRNRSPSRRPVPSVRFEGKGRDRDKDKAVDRPDRSSAAIAARVATATRAAGATTGRDFGGRDKGGRDKRDSGPSHRQWATTAAPRDRDRPADPNSPFAKLAALKEQLAGRKD